MKVTSFIHSSKILVRTFHVFEMIGNHGNTPVTQTIKTLVLGELTVEWKRHKEPTAAFVERKMEREGGKF